MTAILGLILAGGLSSRMGRDKAFVVFRGRPMIEHVAARLAPQVACLAISANGDAHAYACLGAPVLPDVDGRRRGPLAGIAAGLARARETGCAEMVTVPCDAPFAPRDLVARLRAVRVGNHPAVALGAGGVEPLFALWPVDVLPAVEATLASGDASVGRLLDRLGAAHASIPFVEGEVWSLNLNSPDELAEAEAGRS